MRWLSCWWKSTSQDTSVTCYSSWPRIGHCTVLINSWKLTSVSRRNLPEYIRTFLDIVKAIHLLYRAIKISLRITRGMMSLCQNTLRWIQCLRLIQGCIPLSSIWEELLTLKRHTTWLTFVQWSQQRILLQCSRDIHITFIPRGITFDYFYV